MKTLDEVIYAYEQCASEDLMSGCGKCVYKKIRHGGCKLSRNDDALHYLKEYKIKRERIMAKAQDCEDTEKRLQEEIARYQEAVRNCEQAENKYRKAEQDALKALDDWASRPVEENKKLVLTVDNPPLTWDELRTMEGKPVWMEDDTGTKFYRGWAIVLDFEVANGNYLHYECDDYSETCVDVEDIGKTWNAYRKERK